MVDLRSRAARPALHARTDSPLSRLLAAIAVFVVACVVASPLIIHEVRSYRVINPIDEVGYIDYLNQVDHGHFFVGQGQPISRFTQEALVCRGYGTSFVPANDYYLYRAPIPSDCAKGIYPYPLDASSTTAEPPTRDTADIDPPTYYVITDVGTKVLRGLGVTDDLVQAGRFMGIFWAGLGLSLLFLLSRMLGARRLPAALVCLAALGTSGLYSYWCFVTPHASDLAVGAGMVILALQWFRGRLRAGWMVLTGLVPPLVKGSDVVVTALVVVFFLLTAAQRRRAAADSPPSSRGGVLAAAAAVVGFVVASAAFLLARDHYQVSPVADYDAVFHVSGFHVAYLLDQVGAFLVPYQTGAGTAVWWWCLAAALLFALGGAFRFTRDGRDATVVETDSRTDAASGTDSGSDIGTDSDSDTDTGTDTEIGPVSVTSAGRQELAIALLPTLTFGAILFVLSNYLLQHQYHLILPRYGLTLVPTVFALGAVALRGRRALAVGALLVVALGYQAFVGFM